MKTRDEFGKMLNGGYGIELGVSGGEFSKQLLKTSDLKILFSVDRWSTEIGVPHDYNQYLDAKSELKMFGNRSVVLMLLFNEAVDLFQDGIFNFIYIDGDASTGQEDGNTIEEWWPKLKTGGIFGGHDYCDHYSKTKEQVDKFVIRHNVQLLTTDEEPNRDTRIFPSWYCIK
jgi:hypothetical protein